MDEIHSQTAGRRVRGHWPRSHAVRVGGEERAAGRELLHPDEEDTTLRV